MDDLKVKEETRVHTPVSGQFSDLMSCNEKSLRQNNVMMTTTDDWDGCMLALYVCSHDPKFSFKAKCFFSLIWFLYGYKIKKNNYILIHLILFHLHLIVPKWCVYIDIHSRKMHVSSLLPLTVDNFWHSVLI